ncbi:MAG: hypothetical protein IPM39_26835 [Chloroflexi bacterium]|nr:hypothetical protein [Chloroflexota bacterium]
MGVLPDAYVVRSGSDFSKGSTAVHASPPGEGAAAATDPPVCFRGIRAVRRKPAHRTEA